MSWSLSVLFPLMSYWPNCFSRNIRLFYEKLWCSDCIEWSEICKYCNVTSAAWNFPAIQRKSVSCNKTSKNHFPQNPNFSLVLNPPSNQQLIFWRQAQGRWRHHEIEVQWYWFKERTNFFFPLALFNSCSIS